MTNVPVDLAEIYKSYMAAEPCQRFPILQRFIGQWEGCIANHERPPVLRTYDYKISVHGANRIEIVQS